MAQLYKKGNDTSLFLVPGETGGHIDVKSDFDWTTSRRASRDDVVPCYLWEYQPNNAQLINALYYWSYQITQILDKIEFAKIFSELFSNPGQAIYNGLSSLLNSNVAPGAAKDPLDVYKYRYVARPTGFQYILPFLGNERFNVKSTFSSDNIVENFPGIKQLMNSSFGSAIAFSNIKRSSADEGMRAVLGGQMGKTLIEGLSDNKVNVIDTHSWSSTDPDSITINFDLINSGSVEQSIRNYEFCYLMNYQNHPSQRNAFLAQSPCIYTLYIPNTLYMPVCYVPTFNVSNIGQNKMVDGRAMPEAFRVSITFQGILNPPSRNMLSALDNDSKNGDISLPPMLIGDSEIQKKIIDDLLKNFRPST